LEDLSVDGRIILGTILGNWIVKCGQDSSDSVKNSVAVTHEGEDPTQKQENPS
jgi:hypothetical protein